VPRLKQGGVATGSTRTTATFFFPSVLHERTS
jgi:hypothetical protein